MQAYVVEVLLCILSTYVSLSKVYCSGAFELQLDYFQNDHGLNRNGECCNGTRAGGVCTFKCRTFFRICLTHYQNQLSNSAKCTFGEQTTRTFGYNSINFSSEIQHYKNPIKFPFSIRWPGSFTLIVEAWHDITMAGPKTGSPRDLILRMTIPSFVAAREVWTTDKLQTSSAKLNLSYRVVCDPNYYGQSCTQKCIPRDDQFGHYSCNPQNGSKTCLDGWQGANCDQVICLPGCHQEHGYCDLPNQCKCQVGWEGKFCDQCVKLPLCEHGKCINKPWTCVCDEGWGGLYCNQDLNYCTHHKPCMNGAVCTNTGLGSFSCKCQPGFSGTKCEVSSSNCTYHGCQNGGTCRKSGNVSVCECPEGYHGQWCQSDTNSCDGNPCQNGGSCISLIRGYHCNCPAGYTGKDCEQPIDECLSHPCQNGGRCENMVGGFRCVCEPGFDGLLCENHDDCSGNQCLNGGVCQNMDKCACFPCKCRPGFDGPRCERNINECDILPCANGGTCEDKVNDFLCKCVSGFTGKTCNIDIDECAIKPCQNGGICKDRVNDYECICPQGTSGKLCQNGENMSGSSKSSSVQTLTTPTSKPAKGEEWSDVRDPNNMSTVTMEQLLLIVCLGVGIPILIIMAIILFLLCTRRRDNEPDFLKENERNKINSMNHKDKCIDTNVISTLPPNNVCLKVTNEQQVSHLRTHKPRHLNRSLLEKNNTNFKDINTNSILYPKENTDRNKKISNIDRRIDTAGSFEPLANTSDISPSIQMVKPINKEINSKSLFIETQPQHQNSLVLEGMLATQV